MAMIKDLHKTWNQDTFSKFRRKLLIQFLHAGDETIQSTVNKAQKQGALLKASAYKRYKTEEINSEMGESICKPYNRKWAYV